jgi:hypothetical protein
MRKAKQKADQEAAALQKKEKTEREKREKTVGSFCVEF